MNKYSFSYISTLRFPTNHHSKIKITFCSDADYLLVNFISVESNEKLPTFISNNKIFAPKRDCNKLTTKIMSQDFD